MQRSLSFHFIINTIRLKENDEKIGRKENSHWFMTWLDPFFLTWLWSDENEMQIRVASTFNWQQFNSIIFISYLIIYFILKAIYTRFFVLRQNHLSKWGVKNNKINFSFFFEMSQNRKRKNEKKENVMLREKFQRA